MENRSDILGRFGLWLRSISQGLRRRSPGLGRGRSLASGLVISWQRARRRRRRRLYIVAAFVAIAIGVPFGYSVWSGVSAAYEARDAYRELQVELSLI